ncbi:GNAT family N-acetyltransferase [uncultured Pseudokineococcus sp.]|uniref:GNAT family N-acetyltransferase n=1 Tax=uncultured Pseudokineococcus sp. TaxID=1642928 RepID=UPI002616D331|nr:GNAT family N-acetyltransferase [uncultured Pseudokineococcus sp.]
MSTTPHPADPVDPDRPTSSAVRPARVEDVPALDALVHHLAAYEREPEAVEATPDDLRRALFGPAPRVHCLVAEVDGEVAGMALWFLTYSTWRGRHGIWLEDLVVHADHRGSGLGRALLAALAAECTSRGLARLEWSVLDWNAPARGFYAALGAAPQEEWTTWRLDGGALDALGSAAPPPPSGP